ncbi:unnamed protein product [Moneuplotes crassus]|uniref:Uncharacterized protein n=1 Tax=Euplotes crassus TaxID=5936 RepID=A0AAD1U490_EUPCR|nr:unnamed protein product [Moneuplotes crassus]
MNSDDSSIFTTPDLHELWEDITTPVGLTHPDVLATTKNLANPKSDKNEELSPRAQKLKKRILEIQRLNKRCDEFQRDKKSLERTIYGLKEKIRAIHEQHNRERRTLKKEIREELLLEFAREMAKVEDQFKDEIKHLTHEWYIEKSTSDRKNTIVSKLCKILVQTEMTLTNFSLKVRSNLDDTLGLNDFWDSGFDPEPKKIFPKKKVEKSKLEEKVTELESKNIYLEYEVKMTKDLYEDLVNQWEEATKKIRQLEEEKRCLINDYEHKMANLLLNSEDEVAKMKKKVIKQQSQFQDCKRNLVHELKVREILINRHQKYGEVLKTELANAKNIIKDPTALKKATRDLNFQNLKLYPIKTIEDDLRTNKSVERKKVFQSFDLYKTKTSQHSRSIEKHPTKSYLLRKELQSRCTNKSLQKLMDKHREVANSTARTIMTVVAPQVKTPDMDTSGEKGNRTDRIFRIKVK